MPAKRKRNKIKQQEDSVFPTNGRIMGPVGRTGSFSLTGESFLYIIQK